MIRLLRLLFICCNLGLGFAKAQITFYPYNTSFLPTPGCVYLLQGKPGEVWLSGPNGELIRIRNNISTYYPLINLGLIDMDYVLSASYDQDTTYFVSQWFTGKSTPNQNRLGGILKHYSDTIIRFDSSNVTGFNSSSYATTFTNNSFKSKILFEGTLYDGGRKILFGSPTVPASFDLESKYVNWFDTLCFPRLYQFSCIHKLKNKDNFLLSGNYPNKSDTILMYKFDGNQFTKFYWKDSFKIKSIPRFSSYGISDLRLYKDSIYYLKIVDRNGAFPPNSAYLSFKICDSIPKVILDSISYNPERFQLESNGTVWVSLTDSTLMRISKSGKRRIINTRYIRNKFYIQSLIVDTSENTKWIAGYPTGNSGLIRIKDVIPRANVFNQQTMQKQDTFVACLNNRILLKDSSFTLGDGIQSWKWTLPDNSQRLGPEVELSFPIPGRYRVQLSVLDTNGSKGDTAVYITILPGPTVTINENKQISTCKTITLSASTILGDRFRWILPSGDSLSTLQIQISEPGVYIAENALGNCISQDTLTVTKPDTVWYPISLYDPSIIPPVNLGTDSSIYFSTNQPFLLRLEGNADLPDPKLYSPWEWSPSLTPGINSLELYYTPIADFEGSQWIMANGLNNSTGCIASASAKIKFKIPKPFVVNLPNIVTANRDGKNEHFENKEIPFPLGFNLELFNRWGKSIFKKDNYQNEWPQTGTNEGLYFYLLSTPEGTKYSGWVEVIR